MISCAAIQKLERYGQLGQKRRSVDDFVQSSLKDPRRGNVYALTHVPTWEACLAALTEDHGDVDNKGTNSSSNKTEAAAEMAVTPAQVVVINDSLLYAVSFATALVAHHMDEQRFTQQQQQRHKRGETEALDGKVFQTRLEEAVELLSLLSRVAEACGHHANRRNDGSLAVTQALAHLLSTAADAVLIAHVLRHTEAGGTEAVKEEEMLHGLCRSATGLVEAAARQLRTANARHPLSALYNVRPCPTILHQLITKAKSSSNTAAKGTGASSHSSAVVSGLQEGDADAIVTARLLAWAAAVRRGTLIVSLAPFTCFQKLSLVDAVVTEAPASCCCMEVGAYRRALTSLVSSTACNRATRVVVYFRGDDIKLMQNNVRDGTEYALHTHVTTPPVEEATLRAMAELPGAQQQHAALLLVQWMTSIPFFFRSFCAEQSWTAFAQEQRRMVLLQESQARRQRREQRRRGVATRSSNTADGSERSSSVDSKSNSHNGGDVDDEHDDDNDNNDDRHSSFSQQSALSQVSRASMISTMSKMSVASYRTFLSVIDAARNDDEAAEATLHVHQSEDGNTNLPLILLEEVTLALQRFVNAASDAGAGAMLDLFGLRALAWRTIGELYTFIQGTIAPAALPSSSSSSSGVADAETPAVFHLGHDIRYNKGLGYEVLGLLFAQVVLPQLLAARGGPRVVRRSVEAALTRCLSAYEVIAPQVVDQNVPAILRVAAHVATGTVMQPHGESDGNPASTTITATTTTTTTMLHTFLVSLVTRLGKSNQIPMLLDAIVAHVKAEGGTKCATEAYGEDTSNNNASNSGKEGEDEDEDAGMVAGLHEVFAHPHVRTALVQACGMSLDPEELLTHLLAYMSRWASEDDENSDNADASGTQAEAWKGRVATTLLQLLPQQVLFLLDVVATVLEGILATSITASALLERAAELELTLSTLLVNRLHAVFFARDDEEEEEDSSNNGKNTARVQRVFAGADAVRPKLQRRLVLYTLHAIYQARELICSCLQDLGIQNVEAYLLVLEETMWQLETSVGALVGPLTIDDLDATMSRTTQMRHAPHVHRVTLLPQLALQRLTLARSVAVVLNVSVGPASDARRLIAFVLCHMRFASDGGYVPDGDTQQALQLADRLTEEEWRCVVEFGRPRRVRQALVWLLRVTFNSSARSAAVWLTRCLSSCAGFLLEALCDVVMSVTDNEVRVCSRSAESAKKQHRQNTEQQEEEGAPLLQLCAALGNVLRRLGHVPQWPSLLQRAVHWLLLTHAEEKVASAVRPSLLQRRLMQLVMEFLACEEGVYSLLRRTLLQPGEVQQDQQEEQQQQVRRAGRKSGRDKDDVNDAFVQAIGVPFIPSVAMLHAAQSGVSINDDEEEEEEEERGGDSEAAARRTVAVCTLLARRIFSKEFALLLVRYCGTDEAAKAAATKTTEACAASVLWQLYSIALTVCRNERATHDSPSTAHIFVLAVVDAMRRSCKRGDYAAVSTFLSVANGGHVVFAGAARKPASIEATLKRQRHEKKKGEGEEEEEPSSAAAVTAEANTNNDRSDERGTAGEEARIHEVATRWMDLLAALFLQVVQSLATGVDAPLLRAFTALYMSLEKVRGSTTMLLPAQSGEEFATRDNRKRPQQHGRREEGLVSLALAAIAAPRPPSAAGPGLRELFDPSDHEARRRSLATLVRLLTSTEESAMQILWVLFVVHEERRLFASGGDRDTSSGSGWLSLLLSSFDPRQKYTTSDEAMQQLLDTVERGAAATTEEAQRNSRMFTLATLQRGEAACCTDAVTQWLLLQLRVMPSILRAFPTDAAPALLQQYMHALLHEAVKFSVPSSASGLSPCCWGRHEQLLTTASTALQQLSAVPYMRFSVWRGDVKRLLVASGASPLLASGAAAPLWCRVLELCALPLPALHDDCAFVDHELYFLHRLLNGTGVTARRDDAAQRGESEEKLLLCILRLLARTLLPLGVLWRRPHLLPALLSSVLVRCLDGVARGRCGRVVLNQLSSFFYQFVKDATSSDKGSSSSSSSSAAHASSSVKALCLASVTTCLFRLSASYVDVFTTHSSDLDFLAADFLKALQRLHLPRRRTPSILQQKQGSSSNNNWSDATLCDLSYACVGNDDSQSLLRQAAERVEEDEGNGERRIFMVPS